MAIAPERKFDSELTAIGAKLLRAYLECSGELQESARDMIDILNAPDSDDDERNMAMHTLAQIFFPDRNDCGVSIEDLDECAVQLQPDGRSAREELDREEATFSQRLAAVMQGKGVSQMELARRANIGQPAVSMMLGRQCRPQRRTVKKLAEALGVRPGELWPDA